MSVPAAAGSPRHWWRGERGEWLVLAQVALLLLVFFGPRNPPGWPALPTGVARAVAVPGVLLLIGGFALLVAGGLRLGPNLTPLPCPKSGACLITAGVFALVRHPMYAGGIIMAAGWALLVHGWLTLAYAGILAGFANFKAAREERWLRSAFPEYEAYQRRVPRLLPRLPWPSH